MSAECSTCDALRSALTDLCGAVDAICDHDSRTGTLLPQSRTVLELALQRARRALAGEAAMSKADLGAGTARSKSETP